MTDVMSKIAKLPNAVSQQVSNATSRAAKRPRSEVLAALRRKAGNLVQTQAAADKFVKIAQPTVTGYHAGAKVGHLYEQGAKFLFGRGLRTADSPRASRRSFTQGKTGIRRGSGVEDRAKLKNPVKSNASSDRAERFRSSTNALKQEGALGLLVKGAASYTGHLVGTALYKEPEKVDAMKGRFVSGANVVNAGLRTLLVSAPTVAAVGAGIAVGVGVSSAFAAASLVKAGIKQGVRAYRYIRNKPESHASTMAASAAAPPSAASSHANLKPPPAPGPTPPPAASRANVTPPPSPGPTPPPTPPRSAATPRRSFSASSDGSASAASDTSSSNASTASVSSRASFKAVDAARELDGLQQMKAAFPKAAADRAKTLQAMHGSMRRMKSHIHALRVLNPDHSQLDKLTTALGRHQGFVYEQQQALAANSQPRTQEPEPIGPQEEPKPAQPLSSEQQQDLLEQLQGTIDRMVKDADLDADKGGSVFDLSRVTEARKQLPRTEPLTRENERAKTLYEGLKQTLNDLDGVEGIA